MSKNNNPSIFLSYLLRHNPGKIGLVLNAEGWADLNELITKSNGTFSLEILKEIVTSDTKGRYSFDETGTKIRANQGHSIKVDLKMEKKNPPAKLYHGTAKKFLPMIQKQGIKKMSRLHVHLSTSYSTAIKTGMRHGDPVVLEIQSGKMNFDGYDFFISENGIWLTDFVPATYIEIL